MHFLVHAKDADEVGERLLELAHAHWIYLDSFADQLVLRGPTLSGDGSEHTGSVHVLEFLDRAAADRFAFGESYWLAELYRDVLIRPVETLVSRSAFEGAGHDARASSFVTGEWRPSPATHDVETVIRMLERNDKVMYCGLFADEVPGSTVGVVAAMDLAPGDASESLQSVADLAAGEDVHLFAERWRRGGRPSQ